MARSSAMDSSGDIIGVSPYAIKETIKESRKLLRSLEEVAIGLRKQNEGQMEIVEDVSGIETDHKTGAEEQKEN
jgi:hypothetical protein